MNAQTKVQGHYRVPQWVLDESARYSRELPDDTGRAAWNAHLIYGYGCDPRQFPLCRSCYRPFGDGLAIGAWVTQSAHRPSLCLLCDLRRDFSLDQILEQLAGECEESMVVSARLGFDLGKPKPARICSATDCCWGNRFVVEWLCKNKFTTLRHAAGVFLKVAERIVDREVLRFYDPSAGV